MQQHLQHRLIENLRKAIYGNAVLAALEECCRRTIKNPVALKEYHEVLLFLCAYPCNAKVKQLAAEELQRLSQIIKKHHDNYRWQYTLAGSGLPFTELRCQYSMELANWLVTEFSGEIQPAEAEASPGTVKQIFQVLLPGVEFEKSTHGELNTWNRIRILSGHYHNVAALKWLLKQFYQKRWPLLIKDQLYDNLHIYLSWKLQEGIHNRSFNRWPFEKTYYQTSFKKKVSSHSIIRQPLQKPVVLSGQQKSELVSVVRISLAFYYRETDPFTYADLSAVELFDMGRGLQIALLPMQAQHRLSLESYIGFMAFKNGVPVSYGGGWIFGHHCKIGVNIYPPFRGGESAWIFCQVLRLYYQQYTIHRFVVKPYQFGKGNPEGLKSGAFWFYYKLGFRPVNEKIKIIAANEWKKIKEDRSYRTSLGTLRSLTACNKEWIVGKSPAMHPEAADLSNDITSMINWRFKGDRSKATLVCKQELRAFLMPHKLPASNEEHNSVLENWALLFASKSGIKKRKNVHRLRWFKLLETKTKGTEKEYIMTLQRYLDLFTG
ncbi:MAG: hypothetical protein JNK27_15075 [Chitinophagaceae bacterium]|nr:hypothetical protein [Chitinophagaceae bacterium]